MAEPSVPSNTVFIDVASGSEQFPMTPMSVVTEPPKTDAQNRSTSPVDPYLSIQLRRIKCPECQRFTAETEEKLLRHIRKVHRGENPFQCYMCDYSTYNKVLFEEHVRIHQGIKPYKCAHCSYRSVSKKNTKKHELIHRPDNPHKCEECGFIARHVRSLNHHMLIHKQSEGKECTVCKQKFPNMAEYTRHRKGRKRCPECQKTFCMRSLFAQHRLEQHGVVIKKSAMNKKSIFTCAICNWEGNSKPRVLLHLIHHPNQIVDANVVDTRILIELGIMQPCEVLD